MKRAFLAILAFIYIVTTCGITIHMHYCMGKLVDTSFWHDDADHCSSCGMHMDDAGTKGCCSDKHEQLKVQGDQKLAPIQEFQTVQCLGVAIIQDLIQYPEPLLVKLANIQPVSNSPPRSREQPFYLLHRNFRI